MVASEIPLFCSIIAALGTAFGIFLVIHTLYIQCSSTVKIHFLFYCTVFTTILFYTITNTIIMISFIIHISTNTPLIEADESNAYLVIDHSYAFFYCYAMVCMLSVFLFRIQLIFPAESSYALSGRRICLLWILNVFMALFGTIGAICDILSWIIALYCIAVLYIAIIFGLSSYLLYEFVSSLKIMYKSYANCEIDKNDSETMDIYRLMVKITIIARVAILSTFILLIIGGILDVVCFFIDNNNLQYIKRVLFVIDSIVGSLSMALSLVQNDRVYKRLFGRFDENYLKQIVEKKSKTNFDTDSVAQIQIEIVTETSMNDASEKSPQIQ